MDGDLQHRPSDLLKMYLSFSKSVDIVVGCRNLNFNNKSRKLSIIRLSLSKLLIFVIDFILGNKTSDPMSGFFIFKKNLIKYELKFYAAGYKILLDLIYSSKKKIKIKDFKINFRHRFAEYSKINLNILIHLLRSILRKI
jgi:dolichol-phosphate mannosyltransferase